MLIKSTATKTSPNLTVFINLERRITATRINFKFQRYLYLESPGEETGEEKAAHCYIDAAVKFWSLDHSYVKLLLINFWIFLPTHHSYLDPPLINFPDFILQIFQRLFKPIIIFAKL